MAESTNKQRVWLSWSSGKDCVSQLLQHCDQCGYAHANEQLGGQQQQQQRQHSCRNFRAAAKRVHSPCHVPLLNPCSEIILRFHTA
jgi:hypothetical protein